MRPAACFLLVFLAVVEVLPGQKSDNSWKRMPAAIWQDQKTIWSDTFHVKHPKLWLTFGSVTGAFIATDRWTSKQLPNTPDQVRLASYFSRVGAAYSVVPFTGALYLIGRARKDERLQQTGLLSAEALSNSFLIYNVVKVTSQRPRPLEDDGHGRFWHGGYSFPSGHSTAIWSVASVVATEYPHPRIIPILSYGLATTVSASRFAARRHFAADVVAGAAIGWFIGRFVAHKHRSGSMAYQIVQKIK